MNCFCVCESFIVVFIGPIALIQGKLHQNNTIVSTETVDHSSLYSILYIMGFTVHMCKGACVGVVTCNWGNPWINWWGWCQFRYYQIPSYQHRDFHYQDKIVSWPSYLYDDNPHAWKMDFILKQGPCVWELNVINQEFPYIIFPGELTSAAYSALYRNFGEC